MTDRSLASASRSIRPSIPFSFLLPLISLGISGLILLAPMWPALFMFLPGVHFQGSRINLLRLRFWYATDAAWRPLIALNIPGLILELLISVPSTYPKIWHPPQVTAHAWNCITYPTFAAPVWWFAGLGFDAFSSRKPRGRAITIIASLLSLGCAFLAIGMYFGLYPSERVDIGWIQFGFGLWAVLFASFPAAWIRTRFSPAIHSPQTH